MASDLLRYCNQCRSKTLVYLEITSRRKVKLTCTVCKSTYDLPRYPCVS